jgi:hypothetical protein
MKYTYFWMLNLHREMLHSENTIKTSAMIIS